MAPVYFQCEFFCFKPNYCSSVDTDVSSSEYSRDLGNQNLITQKMFVSTSIGISSLRDCVLAEGDTCFLCQLFEILAKENLNRFLCCILGWFFFWYGFFSPLFCCLGVFW